MHSIILFLITFKIVIAVDADDIPCGVVPISHWGGTGSHRKEELQTPVDLVVIQHSVTPTCSSDASCEAILKSIRFYQTSQGFDDVGQSFFIGNNGKVYEGAGWRVGAHTRGYNNRSIALSFLGDFREHLPTSQALRAAQNFLSCATGKKYLKDDYYLVGHSQLSLTLSPGADLQTVIQTWPHWLEDIKKLKT